MIDTEFGDEKELSVVKNATLAEFEKYAKLNKKVQPDVHSALERIEEFDRLSDTLAAHMPVAVKHKQKYWKFQMSLLVLNICSV
ncbi:lon protease [Pasteurella canis]|nr:lon protease [Pasteurella canis]